MVGCVNPRFAMMGEPPPPPPSPQTPTVAAAWKTMPRVEARAQTLGNCRSLCSAAYRVACARFVLASIIIIVVLGSLGVHAWQTECRTARNAAKQKHGVPCEQFATLSSLVRYTKTARKTYNYLCDFRLIAPVKNDDVVSLLNVRLVRNENL